MSCSPRTALLVLSVATLCAFAAAPVHGQPPYPPVPPLTQPSQQTQVVGRPTAPPAAYAPAPVNPQMYAPGYAPYAGAPYYNPGLGGGALTGAANAINAQGEYEKQFQQSRLTAQDVERSKLATRRATLDEWQYEKSQVPTVEDMREKQQYANLRRSLNDPPPAEIWSGTALNDLLSAIKLVKSPGDPGPMIPIDPNMTTQLSLTTGVTANGVGLLKNGPRLRWPLALQDDSFDATRTEVEGLMKTAYDQASSGGEVSGKVLRQLYKGLDNLDAGLKAKIEDMTPTQNVQAKRYVREVRDTVRVFEQPDLQNVFAATRPSPAASVGELVTNMLARGQTFAPALAGSEPAYTALQTAMASYYQGLTNPTLRSTTAYR